MKKLLFLVHINKKLETEGNSQIYAYTVTKLNKVNVKNLRIKEKYHIFNIYHQLDNSKHRKTS